ncbi:endoribonuclease ysh1 [Serendipita sp. 397]|nr:endoribonuclease ysh1 [Serendipita sp. 397]
MQQIRCEHIAAFLESHFGSAEIDLPDDTKDRLDDPAIIVHVDQSSARVNINTLAVSCKNEALRSRVQSVVQMAATTINSLTEMYGLKDIHATRPLQTQINDARFKEEDEDLLKEEEDDEVKMES